MFEKCIKHKKDLIYTFNKCEDCLKELEKMNKDDNEDNNDNEDNEDNDDYDDYDDNNEVDRSKKFDEKNEFKIVIKRTPEKLENILFTNEEINELKEKIKIIEDKVKSFNSKKKNNWQYGELIFFINIYYSLIYTYEYLLKKNCLNYNVVKNLRRIKLLPDFNINDREESFFDIYSMKRFLNGEIKKNDELIDELYTINFDDYYYKFADNAEKVGKFYFKSYDGVIDFYSGYHFENLCQSNLFDFLEGENNCCYKIRNLNFCCVFNEKEIKILSFTIEDNQCIMKLHQIFKFNRNLKLLKKLEFTQFGFTTSKSNNNFNQENDGSKLYILYENELIILSKNDNNFQIDTLIKCGKSIKSYIVFYKYKNTIIILANNDKRKITICEINLINYKIKYEHIDIDYSDHYNYIILKRYLLFQKYDGIWFYDLNKKQFIKYSMVYKPSNGSYLDKNLKCIENFDKIENVFIIERIDDNKSDYFKTIFYEFWRIENNKIEYLYKVYENY